MTLSNEEIGVNIMTNEIFLGVDGGGTKTAFLLEVNGEKYEDKQITIHPKQVSKEDYFKIMELGVTNVCQQAGINPSEIDYTFVASPGYGQYPATEEYIHEGVRRVLGNDNFTVENDAVNGWAGSLNASPGINIVIGTGAIGFGVDQKGNTMRCSGWGPLLGDEASGYWIGLKILNLFTKMSDGRIEKTKIYDFVKEKLGINEDFEIFEVVENMRREEIASFSVILGEALNNNDPNALDILDDITDEIALTIDTIAKNLDFNGPIDVSFSGGVTNIGEALFSEIEQKVEGEVNIKMPFTTPVEGSIILAKKLHHTGSIV